MIIAFKHRRSDGKSLVDTLIAWWTNSEWIHCEVLVQHPDTGAWWAFSARSDDRKVSGRPLAEVIGLATPRWELYRVPEATGQQQALWNWLQEQCNTPYDYRGLVNSMILGRPSRLSDQWFCSELAMATIQRFSSLDWLKIDPAYVSPGGLRTWLKNERCGKITITYL
jgi:hypothetical protein